MNRVRRGRVSTSRPELVEEIHEGVVDHEGDGDVQADAAQSWHRALVERHRALLLPYLRSAVPAVFVLRRLQTLQNYGM